VTHPKNIATHTYCQIRHDLLFYLASLTSLCRSVPRFKMNPVKLSKHKQCLTDAILKLSKVHPCAD